MILDFSRSAPPCDGPLNIAPLDHRRVLLRRAQASLHRTFRRMPAASRRSISSFPDITLPRRLGAASGRRLHRNHPAGDRRDLRARFAQAAPEARERQPVRNHQRAFIGRLARAWPALVMFLLLRRGGSAAIRKSDGPQSRQQPDLRPRRSRHLEILESLYPIVFTQWALRPDSGGPGRHRGGLGAIYEIEALADGATEVFSARRAWKVSAAGGERRAVRRRSIVSAIRPITAEATPPLASKVTDVKIQGAGRRCGWRRRAAAASAIPRGETLSLWARDTIRLGYVTWRKRPRATTRRARMSLIVGIDVGGTFTDLFRFDAATRRFVTAKVPSRRGDEAAGFPQRPARARRRARRLDRARHDGRHQYAAGAAWPQDRRHHDTRLFRDVLEMRRRDPAPAHGALWGDFTPIADRDMRLEVAERTLADGTIRTPGRRE